MTETGRTTAQENFSFGEAQAALLRIVFQTGNCSVFPQNLKLFRFPAKPIKFVIARWARAPDAAIFDDSFCHSVTKYSYPYRNITLK